LCTYPGKINARQETQALVKVLLPLICLPPVSRFIESIKIWLFTCYLQRLVGVSLAADLTDPHLLVMPVVLQVYGLRLAHVQLIHAFPPAKVTSHAFIFYDR
jgi:hypothetical protein